MKEMTERQQTILEFIKQFIRKEGYPPTVRELAQKFEMKSSSMFDHLTALERKGFLKRLSRKSRSLELSEFIESKRMATVREIPILGRVAAGKPLLAVENLDGSIFLDKSWVRNEKVFALKVKGDSMIDAHILDGDMVMVRSQNDVENGEIVVVLIADEVTVKRFYREQEKIRLQPENPTMEPLMFTAYSTEFTILGKVIGVFRKL
ncbi:MAG: transcriptional repressor LexA [bacterium]|nr:transcriptional repressor LexA [bacterium]